LKNLKKNLKVYRMNKILKKDFDFSALLPTKRDEWNKMIEIARSKDDKELKKEVIQKITFDVNYLKGCGVNVVGYDVKSIYRKFNTGIKPRKVRQTKGIYLNQNVNKMLSEIVRLATKYYFAAAKANYRLTTEMILQESRSDERLYEIAAIPFDTLLRTVTNELKKIGSDTVHMYLNHRNTYHATRAYNHGATSDINFMDYIMGDDHKFDIHTVPEFNEIRNKLENKTIYSWFWHEPKTLKVLSYVIKTSEITTEDLKISFLEALAFMGRPAKAVLVDNGVGRSAEFQHFCAKLKLPVELAKAYCPTEKATIERMFKIFKDEHDVFFNNYTGSKHATEGRHPGLSLTPEQANYTVGQFVESMGYYLQNMYETRERQRSTYGKQMRMSIRQNFDEEYSRYEINAVDPKLMRFAYMKEKLVQYKNSTFKFKGEFYLPDVPLPLTANKKKFTVAYNPNNLNSIDIYATVQIVDVMTGVYYDEGDFVCTCSRVRTLATSDRQALVVKNNQHRTKAVKEVVKLFLDGMILENPHLKNAINSRVQVDGKIVNVRMKLEKFVKKAIEEGTPEAELKIKTEQELEQYRDIQIKKVTDLPATLPNGCDDEDDKYLPVAIDVLSDEELDKQKSQLDIL